MSGRFRVRYAANGPLAATRERFPGRTLTEADGELYLVVLESMPSALNLTHQANLDVLGLDDRVSTGRIDGDGRADPDPLLDTCGRLADALYDWWDQRPPPIVYRTRTMPARGRSLAFCQGSSGVIRSARKLHEATALHVRLVMQAGFTVPDGWLA